MSARGPRARACPSCGSLAPGGSPQCPECGVNMDAFLERRGRPKAAWPFLGALAASLAPTLVSSSFCWGRGGRGGWRTVAACLIGMLALALGAALWCSWRGRQRFRRLTDARWVQLSLGAGLILFLAWAASITAMIVCA